MGQEFKFESGKAFSNVFYPEKEDVVKRLDFFSKNKEWYKQRGIPYTMGFLFYGDPGCGKTSTIKAIANHTQRHIVSVPLNDQDCQGTAERVLQHQHQLQRHPPRQETLRPGGH